MRDHLLTTKRDVQGFIKKRIVRQRYVFIIMVFFGLCLIACSGEADSPNSSAALSSRSSVNTVYSTSVSSSASVTVLKIFISEVALGTSSNKYIELYNPTDAPVSLTGWAVGSVMASATAKAAGYYLYEFAEGVIIPARGCLVLAHNLATSLATSAASVCGAVVPYADVPGGRITSFTTSNRIELYEGNTVVDRVVGTGSALAADTVYVRKPGKNASAVYNAADWIITSPAVYSDVGDHTYADNGESSGSVAPLTDAERWQSYGEPTAPPGSAAKYTIMTYNVDGFDRGWSPQAGGSRPMEHSRIAAIIKTNQVEVLALNEILQGTDSTNKSATDATDFNAALNAISYPMNYFNFTTVSDGWNNIAYFSRQPVSDASEFRRYPLSGANQGTYMTRAIYRYKVTFPGNNVVWFYSAHLKALADDTAKAQRKNEAKGLANYIRANHNLKTEYIVIYGDMNTNSAEDWPGGVGLPSANATENNPSGNPKDCTLAYLELRDWNDPDGFFTSLTRVSIYPNTTFPGFVNGLPLDHIVLSPALYRKHYVPGSAKRIGQGMPGPGVNDNPTDHYAVRCELYF